MRSSNPADLTSENTRGDDMARTTKEAAYDKHISPLMAKIIALCKQYKINMLADFALGIDPVEDQDLFCTTCLPIDDDDEIGKARMIRGKQALLGEPKLFAFTITEGSR